MVSFCRHSRLNLDLFELSNYRMSSSWLCSVCMFSSHLCSFSFQLPSCFSFAFFVFSFCIGHGGVTVYYSHSIVFGSVCIVT